MVDAQRRFALDRNYGLTLETFEHLLRRQNGECAICGEDITGRTLKGRLKAHVDHDHATGAVRELLCQGCNMGLGAFKDSPARLRQAAAYISKHKLSTRSIP